jgi:hypothetical protein
MKALAAAASLGFLVLISGCASRDAATGFPETPDPAAARRLAGDWVFTMKTADREIDGRLHFSYDGSFVSGSFTEMGGDVREISDVRVSKDRMAWKIAGDRATEQLTGSFSGDGSLSGQMTLVRKHESGDEGNEQAPQDGGSRGGYGHGGGHGRHGGGGGAHRSGERSPAKWTAVPAPKAGGDSKSG